MKPIKRRYPVGIQTFSEIIELNCVYIDKTALIYQMVNEAGKSYFLSRPRRFGKSVLISTLEAYFEGRKELFKGLAIEQLETEWNVHPVLRLDLSRSTYGRVEELTSILEDHLYMWEELYGGAREGQTFASRFGNVIKRAYQKTGQKVVILIDEYDSALIDSNSDPELQKELRTIVRSFYAPLKDSDRFLRFVFLTGITKFSQMSIFSELNNLNNISMVPYYDTICGISETELYTQMAEDIRLLAEALNKTEEEMRAELKKRYDGYHFSKGMTDIYNPFSLLTAFTNKMLESYWFSTGTPSFLLELIKKEQLDISKLEGITATAVDFDRSTERISNVLPVLYQSGYLTIKDYNPLLNTYTLGYPNQEVRMGFLHCLIPDYVHTDTIQGNFMVVSFLQNLMEHQLEECMVRLQSFFADIPNTLHNKNEKHYQTALYILFKLMGQYVEAEVSTAIGRIDAVLQLADAIYLFEFKVDKSAQEALEQIDSKQYGLKYAMDGRPIYKIGVNFSTETRTLSEWIIVEGK
ncbi:MAG: ATP-binding protein [Phocaeicola sp.]